MKHLIMGNWKMNPGSLKEAREIFDAIKAGIKDAKAEVVICAPFVYLAELKGLPLGAQDVFYEQKGTFTGEISPGQLKDLGAEYVLVGHSERRKLGETNEVINKKLKAALAVGLKPVLCVGEHEAENREEVLQKQITEGLLGVSDVSNLVIAYEPVWAISGGDPYATKKLPTVAEAKAAKECIQKILGDNASNVRIIYGGSANAENAKQYLEVMDGLLPGGASLKPEEFIAIVGSV